MPSWFARWYDFSLSNFHVSYLVLTIGMQLCATGGWICFALQGQYGLGHHTETISAADLVMMTQIGFWLSVVSAGAALGLLKIAIALSLLRFANVVPWYKWSLWVTIGENSPEMLY